MNIPIILGCLWLIGANFLAMFPSRDHHWRAAYALIALGIPIVGWITWTNGPVLGLIFLAAGMSVLRWPLFHLARWLKRLVRRGSAE